MHCTRLDWRQMGRNLLIAPASHILFALFQKGFKMPIRKSTESIARFIRSSVSKGKG